MVADKCSVCGAVYSEVLSQANERTTYSCGAYGHPEDPTEFIAAPTCLINQIANRDAQINRTLFLLTNAGETIPHFNATHADEIECRACGARVEGKGTAMFDNWKPNGPIPHEVGCPFASEAAKEVL